MTFGIDHAWGTPDVEHLHNAGVTFVCRYLSHDTTGKNLTAAEAVRLTVAGIRIVVVWETRAQRALDGHAAGVQDAKDAAAQAKACGMPPGRPIYFAVDFDASQGQQAAINAYLDGAASVIGKNRVGIYGGYWPVKRALDGGHATWAWQTYAWSGTPTMWDKRAQIQQYLNDQMVGGVDCDYNRTTKTDFGQWGVGWTPGPLVPPPATTKGDDMPSGQISEGTGAVTPIAVAKGQGRAVSFLADNGRQELPPAHLRVAIHAPGGWHIEPDVIVDSTKGATTVPFPNPAGTDGVSVQRTDTGNVHVSYIVT